MTMAMQSQQAEILMQRAREVLATLDGQMQVPGLRESVEVHRDRWGIPHIYAENAHDLFFAQGFVAAQDRLFQMDMWRRTGVGETAAVLGPQAIEADRFARLVKYRGDMQQEWTSYSPDAQEICTAFTSGINAYIDQVQDRLPIEFQQLGFKPAKWRPEDCLGRMSGIIMARNFRQEIERAQLIEAVGAETARMLRPTDPPRPFAVVPGLDLKGIDKAILAGYDAATKAFDYGSAPHGSNNWVVDGTKSASGKPMMASDPHRALTLPALRYLVHLHAPGWNVIGGGEPGLPGVALGHNENVAWGFTIVGTDQSDLFVETTHPDNPLQYRVGQEWQPMQVIRETIQVRGEASPHELELCFTRHGPVIHRDPKRHRAYALKWVGQEPGAAAYLASLALDRARNAQEFMAAAAAWKMPSENIVFADVEGNIGWIAAALTPIRKGWDGLLPVPGDDDEFAWRGFLSSEQLPQALNPPEHVISTANHKILPAGYPHEIAYEWAPSYRQDRIMERLMSRPKFDMIDFQNTQHDVISIPGRRLVKLIREHNIEDPQLQAVCRILSQWDGSLSRESRGATIYAVWLQEMLQSLYRDRVPQPLLESLTSGSQVPVLLEILEKPDARWFGANPAVGRDTFLRETLSRAHSRIQALLGPNRRMWNWGRLHTITFTHPLASLGKEHAAAYNLGPIGRPGDGLTPNATRHDDKFQQVNGATYRHIFDLADWDLGLVTSAPGQSGQPGSPHYDDLLSQWAEGQYFPLAYSRKKVQEVTAHRLVLLP